jgi:murein DD-endopeptidase MepM/ murein hydrolase activator NlpD
MRSTTRRILLGVAIAIAAAIAGVATVAIRVPLLRHPFVLLALRRRPPAMRLPVPVDGVSPRQLTDSWGSPRPGGRHHEGIDIFAKRGTPVRSTTDGIVLYVGDNSLGGHVVEILGPGFERHYYAHLDRFANMRGGDAITAGTLLGYVGNTGDAITTPTHLHYGIYSGVRTLHNPYPRLRGQRPQRGFNAGSAARP